MDERCENGRESEGSESLAESPFTEDRDSVSLTLGEPLLRASTARISTTSQLAIVGSNVCPIESLDYEYVIFVGFLVTCIGLSVIVSVVFVFSTVLLGLKI